MAARLLRTLQQILVRISSSHLACFYNNLPRLRRSSFAQQKNNFIKEEIKLSGKSRISVFLVRMLEMTCARLHFQQRTAQQNTNDDKCSKVHEINFQKQYETESALGSSRFKEHNFLMDKINRVLANDTVNILCEIIYDSNLAEIQKMFKNDPLPDYCRLKEFDGFEKLWEAENSTDVAIKIEEDEIKVHKLIIMNRSPVFKAMFEHDMKEKEQSVVVITDIKYYAMRKVLRFMYTGEVDEIEKIACDLLLAAEKYSMKGLKVMCEKQIFNNLTIANAVEHLKLADMINAMNLKSEIIKFIARNQKDVIHTAEFKLLPMKIECEVLRAIVGIDVNK